MSKEAMKLALEALEKALRYHGVMLLSDPPQDAWKYHRVEQAAHEAITALREALAEQPAQQEPFGYFRYDLRLDAWVQNRAGTQGTPFYTSPPAQRTWVGLTDEEIKLVMDGCGEEGDDDYVKPAFDPFGISEDDLMNFARAIEAKLKEKNNG